MPCTFQNTPVRTTFWLATVAGWGGSLAAVATSRHDYTFMLWVLPFLLAVALTGSVGVLLSHLLPDLARVYAIGYRHGMADGPPGG